MVSNFLVLVDDIEIGFWNNRPEFEPSQWPKWQMRFMDGEHYSETKTVIEEIQQLLNQGPVHVITDGQLFDGTKGSHVLEAIIDHVNFRKGVVFSSDPFVSDKLKETGRVIGLDREPFSDQVSQIRTFFESLPKSLNLATSDNITTAIHSLENLALPLTMDFDTLATSHFDASTAAEIYRDYFNVQVPVGYLASDRCFHGQSDGLEGAVKRTLDPLKALSVPSINDILAPYVDNDSVSLMQIRLQLKLSAIRSEAASKASDVQWLRDSLQLISGTLLLLAKSLRQHRASVSQST